MLNYIWLTLILLGAGFAVWSDWRDAASDRYRNDAEVRCAIVATGGETAGTLSIAAGEFAAGYGESVPRDLAFDVRLTGGRLDQNSGSLNLEVPLDDRAPRIWREIAGAQRSPGVLRASIRGDGQGGWMLRTDPVRLPKLTAVTNDGIVKYAKTAVELAIGLVGIMALWLGLMKIAEQAGMVAALSRALKPVTAWLFPDVPPGHPAMGAMLMNISANVLGLANAATPLGLKAMEELNKLSRKAGTATDAMCTFLVINTSSVQLIPATVIALRAAAGSAAPTEIIGPVIVATTLNTVVGVVVVRLLSKLPFFRNQLKGGKDA